MKNSILLIFINIWFQVNSQTFVNYSLTDGLPSSNITSILGHSNGKVYATSYNGQLCEYDGTSWSIYFNNTGRAMNKVIESHDHNFWIASNYYGAIWSDLFSMTLFDDSNSGLIGNNVKSIIQDNLGYIWFATTSGLCSYNDNPSLPMWTLYTSDGANSTNPGLPANFIWCVFEDSQGNIWVGSQGAGVGKMDVNGIWTKYTTSNGLSGNTVYSITEDNDGYIWFGTNFGASKFKASTWTTVTTYDGVNAVYKDINNNMWIGFYSKGLERISSTGNTFYTVSNGLVSNYITGITQDKQNNIWVSTDGGISKITIIDSDIYEVNNDETASYNGFVINPANNNTNIKTVSADIHNNTDVDYYKIQMPASYNYSISSRVHDSYNNGDGQIYSCDVKYSYKIGTGNWSSIENTQHNPFIVSGGTDVYFKIEPYTIGNTGTYILEVNIDKLYSISGTVTSNSIGLPGVSIDYGSGTTTTDASGNYSLSVLSGSNIIITPSKSSFTFTPANIALTNISTNQYGLNFTAPAAPVLTVSATSLTIAAPANSTNTFDITSNIAWTALSDQTWLTINTAIGTGNATITLTAALNPTNSTRIATVTISGNGVTNQTISISQDGLASEIKGTIKDVDLNFSTISLDNPVVANCNVYLLENNTNTIISQTITDSKGVFLFSISNPNKSYSLKAAYSKANTSKQPIECSVMYDNIVANVDTTILIPMGLHLLLERNLDNLKTNKVYLSNNVTKDVSSYDISILQNTVNQFKFIKNNSNEVISKMWRIALAMRVQNRLNMETPLLVTQFMGNSADLLKGIVGVIPILSQMKKEGSLYNLAEGNRANAFVIGKALKIDNLFKQAFGDDIDNILDKITKPLPNSEFFKEFFTELVKNVEMEVNTATEKGGLGVDKSEIVKFIVGKLFEQFIVDWGNKKLVGYYTSSTQKDVDNLSQINLQLNLNEAITKTNSLLQTVTSNNSAAISKSIKLKLWGDMADIFSDFADDVADVLIVSGAGSAPGAGVKALAKVVKIASPVLIGASIIPPANRYFKMFSISHDWYNNIDNVEWKSKNMKSIDLKILKSGSIKIKTIAVEYNNQLKNLISAINTNAIDTVIWNNYAKLIELGNLFDKSIETALKPIKAALLYADEYTKLDSIYFAVLPNTINSPIERMAFNFNFYSYLLKSSKSFADSINVYAINLIKLNESIDTELDIMNSKIAGINISAFVSSIALDIPETMVRNSSYKGKLTYKNFGTVNAINLYSKIFKNGNILDSINIVNLAPDEEKELQFDVKSLPTDSLVTYKICFYSNNAVVENNSFTLLNTDFSIYEESISQNKDSIVLQVKVQGIFEYQWYKNEVPILYANTPKFVATENGAYSLKIKSGTYTQISNIIGINNIISSLNSSLKDISSIYIFPNPSSNFLTIQGIQENSVITIFDINGKQILNKQLSTKQIDVSHLQNGEYIIKIKDRTGTITKKFIKE